MDWIATKTAASSSSGRQHANLIEPENLDKGAIMTPSTAENDEKKDGIVKNHQDAKQPEIKPEVQDEKQTDLNEKKDSAAVGMTKNSEVQSAPAPIQNTAAESQPKEKIAESDERDKDMDKPEVKIAERQPDVKIAEPEMDKAEPVQTSTVESHVDVKPKTAIAAVQSPALPEIPTDENQPKHEGTSLVGGANDTSAVEKCEQPASVPHESSTVGVGGGACKSPMASNAAKELQPEVAAALPPAKRRRTGKSADGLAPEVKQKDKKEKKEKEKEQKDKKSKGKKDRKGKGKGTNGSGHVMMVMVMMTTTAMMMKVMRLMTICCCCC